MPRPLVLAAGYVLLAAWAAALVTVWLWGSWRDIERR